MFVDDDETLSREQKEYFASVKRSKKIIKLIRFLYVIVVLPFIILSYYSMVFFTIGFFIFVILYLVSLVHKNNIK